MLKVLYIQNFLFVSKLSLCFEEGLTAITGESGAGKSVMLHALNLCLGARLEKNQKTDKNLFLEASFLPSKSILAYLSSEGFSFDKEGSVRLSRRFDSTQKNLKAYINDKSVTLNRLKDIGSLLISLSKQHAQQHLFHPEAFQKILDQFGNHQALLLEVNGAYNRYSKLLLEAKDAEASKEKLQVLIQELGENLSSLEKSPLEEKKLEKIFQEYERLNYAKEDGEFLSKAHDFLENEEFGALNALSSALRFISSVKGISQKEAWLKELEESIETLRDMTSDLQRYTENEDFSEERLLELQEFVSHILSLERQHQLPMMELHVKRDELREKLLESQERLLDLKNLEPALKKHLKHYYESSFLLSQARKSSKEELEHLMLPLMKELGFQGSRFVVALETLEAPSASGAENISFLLQHDESEALPIEEIASGGEISRLNLAFTSILHEKKNQKGTAETLILDEADTGTSGDATAFVAKLFQKIAKNTQVILITHQAVVAAASKHHILLSREKITQKEPIAGLLEEERELELSRLIGGTLESAKTHAKQLRKDFGA